MSASVDRRFLRDAARIFHRALPDGRRVYREQDVRALLFLLYLELPEGDASELSSDAKELIGEYALRIGLRPNDDAKTMASAVERYYRAHPIDAQLRAELDQLLRDKAVGVYAEPSTRAFARVLGTSFGLARPPNPADQDFEARGVRGRCARPARPTRRVRCRSKGERATGDGH